jgi:hypothetical protein
MERRKDTVVLIGVIAVILLGLYRNFGVPILRFWPLILFDTILRIPGDIILKLVKPPLPKHNWPFPQTASMRRTGSRSLITKGPWRLGAPITPWSW